MIVDKPTTSVGKREGYMKTLLLISVLMVMVSCTTNSRKTASDSVPTPTAAGPTHLHK